MPRGNGNKSAPAMAAAKRSVARGAGNIGVRSLGKIMKKSSTARRTSALVASKSTAAIGKVASMALVSSMEKAPPIQLLGPVLKGI